ncbi:MAG: hypothetical protein OXC44_03190 [Proteobacteria bacterium]|nr:hypothetical protein [Pseudomonadota bacterium]
MDLPTKYGSLEKAHKLRNMIQHVFLEIHKFNKETDGVDRDGCLFEAFMYIAKRWSILTEDVLTEMILIGGNMAKGTFEFSYIYVTPTEEEIWFAIDRQKKQEELALAEAERKGMQKGMQKAMQEAEQKAMQEAEQKAMQEGMQEAKTAVARRMLSMGLDVEIISLSTELTPEEVTKLADSTTQ